MHAVCSCLHTHYYASSVDMCKLETLCLSQGKWNVQKKVAYCQAQVSQTVVGSLVARRASHPCATISKCTLLILKLIV